MSMVGRLKKYTIVCVALEYLTDPPDRISDGLKMWMKAYCCSAYSIKIMDSKDIGQKDLEIYQKNNREDKSLEEQLEAMNME